MANDQMRGQELRDNSGRMIGKLRDREIGATHGHGRCQNQH